MNDIITYQTEQGEPLNVRWEEETVWLSQKLIAKLFGVDTRTINEHLQNIYNDGELQKHSTIRKIRIVQQEGGRQVSRQVDFYNLDAIISVGYRVNSSKATNFRIWATQVLKNHLLRGYAVKPVNGAELEDIREELRNLEITTDAQFSEIYEALIALVSRKQIEDKPRNPIGFIHLTKGKGKG